MLDLENVFKVHEVTAHIKNLLEKNIGTINVEGEITNLSKPASGHIYFSLKDERALIKCAFFSGYNRQLSFVPKNGDKVVVIGKVTVYERDGQYQIIVNSIIPFGTGLLHQRYEQLKEKLRQEGLFDTTHKKSLPIYPSSIGLVTSKTGAVLQDMINILSKRLPADIYLYPASVQGAEAPQSLIAGVEYFSQNPVDVIIIGRGGGSFEDLFCFNDEALARTIYLCPIPIISAVGHETDFTICDFVADVRAATPSVAAEMVIPSKVQFKNLLNNRRQQLLSILSYKANEYRNRLNSIKQRYEYNIPEIYPLQQTIDFARFKVNKITEHIATKKKNQIKNLKTRLNLIFLKKIHSQYSALNISQYKQRLESLSPKNTLNRGYAIISKNKKIITSHTQLKKNDKIEILLKDGKSEAIIESLSHNPS